MAVVPGMTELTRPYWEAAREGRLVVQECLECHQLRHPPLPACPDCACSCHGSVHSSANRTASGKTLGWREVSGTGTVYAYTVVRHPTHVAFADEIPYVIALVELSEGPRLVTGITGCPPDQVRAGMAVRVVFREVADGVTLPYFEPAP